MSDLMDQMIEAGFSMDLYFTAYLKKLNSSQDVEGTEFLVMREKVQLRRTSS